MANLLNVDDALAQILSTIHPLPPEQVELHDGLGRVLASDIQSTVDLPAFANSSMDGYAVRAEDIAEASKDHPVTLTVVMDIPAGAAPQQTLQRGQAARIMTGAPIPDGADTIVPVELTDSEWSAREGTPPPPQVRIYHPAKLGENVRPVGENVKNGDIVLRAGHILRPQDIGIIAALGQPQISVIRQPRVAVLSSGDELVGVDEPLTAGKIRDVNSYTIAGMVRTAGAIPLILPIARDTLDDVRHLFYSALACEPDVIVSSAGVSVGAADLIRTVLDELGEVNFWRINLRPGKPLAYGHLRGVPFFGLPGNPVSAMVTFEVFVRPVLLRLGGKTHDPQIVKAITAEAMRSDGRRSYIRVTLKRENGKLIAHETGTQSSGALISMVLADGLLIIPEDMRDVPSGTELDVYLLA